MKTNPHGLFECWTPDTVAECMEGVEGDLYRTLWDLVEFYHDLGNPETPDTHYGHVFGNDLALPFLWNRLTEADRLKLNELAERHMEAA